MSGLYPPTASTKPEWGIFPNGPPQIGYSYERATAPEAITLASPPQTLSAIITLRVHPPHVHETLLYNTLAPPPRNHYLPESFWVLASAPQEHPQAQAQAQTQPQTQPQVLTQAHAQALVQAQVQAQAQVQVQVLAQALALAQANQTYMNNWPQGGSVEVPLLTAILFGLPGNNFN